jgi:hypothetical protein
MTDDPSRAASLAQIGGFRPPEDPKASWAGRVRVARPGETWPLADGEPMLALAQLNLTEAPVLPPALEGLAMVTVFVGPRELTHWALRAYESLDDLVELAEPERPPDPKARKGEAPTLKGLPIRWQEVTDEADEPLDGLKLGGFPVEIQDEVDWGGLGEDVEFAVQIDSDDRTGYSFGYGGVLYIGRAHGGVWVLDWQSL